MNQNISNNYDHSFEQRLTSLTSIPQPEYRVSKKYFSLTAEQYKQAAQIAASYNGRYVGGEGGQYFLFREMDKAQEFSRELFLRYSNNKQIHNHVLPFTDLVFRQEEGHDNVFRIFRDTPEADGSKPIIGYFEANDNGGKLRTPKLKEKIPDEEMNALGSWNEVKDSQKEFVFKDANAFYSFATQNAGVSVAELYPQTQVRYEEEPQKQQEAEAIDLPREETVQAPVQHKVQDKGDTDSGDDTAGPAEEAKKPRSKAKKDDGQLSLFPDEEPTNETKKDDNSKQQGGHLRTDDEERPASNTDNSSLSDGGEGTGNGTEQRQPSDGPTTDTTGDDPTHQQQGGVPRRPDIRPARESADSTAEQRTGGHTDTTTNHPGEDGRDDTAQMGGVHQKADDGIQSTDDAVNAGTEGVPPTVQPVGDTTPAEPAIEPAGGSDSPGDDNEGLYGQLSNQNEGAWLFAEHGNQRPEAGTAEAKGINRDCIQLVATLLEENRLATEDEKEMLAKYTGMGNLHLVIDDNPSDYRDLSKTDFNISVDIIDACKRICSASERLSETDLRKFGLDAPIKLEGVNGIRHMLQESQKTAFYTPEPYIKPIYEGLEKLGFKGGQILEPSAGIGDFISASGRDMISQSKVTAVEMEPVSGIINKCLHPEVEVHIGRLQDHRFGVKKYDLSITNDPFGVAPAGGADPEFPRQYGAATHFLHTYFPVKMMDRTNAGGLMAVITTSGLMDSPTHKETRKIMAEQGEFIGGVRLPYSAFDKAQVNADVLLFKVWNSNEDKSKQLNAFVNTVEKETEYERGGVSETLKYNINAYFDQHPDHIIGQEKVVSREYGMEHVYDDDLSHEEVGEQLREKLGGVISSYLSQKQSVGLNIEHEETQTVQLSPKEKAFNELAQTFDKLCKASMVEDNEEEQRTLRSQLNRQYDYFVTKFGFINQRRKQRDLLGNVNYPKLAAIENIDPVDPKKFIKAEIFRKNTIRPVPRVFDSKDPQDVVNYSYRQFNHIDPMTMKTKLGDDWLEKCRGLVYLNPATRQYEPTMYYLSGDVKTKLEEAVGAAKDDPRFEANVKALTGVQPKDLDFTEISINFGANFVPVEFYRDYIAEEFLEGARRSSFDLQYKGSGWSTPYEVQNYNKKYFSPNVLNNLTFGENGFQRGPQVLIGAALNNRLVKVNKRDPANPEEKITDVEATFNANQKVREIRAGFEEWLGKPENADKVKVIVDNYNRMYNRTVEPKFSSSFVQPVGCTIQLREHQAEALARTMTGNNTYLDHAPGLGKTFILACTAMEQKRVGMAQKNLLICMKANTQDIAKDFLKAYPNANILCPTEADFSKANRHQLLNRIKTNDYDCVILTHDQYCKLKHSPEAVERVVDEYFADYENMIATKKAQLEQGEIDGVRMSDDDRKKTVKELKDLEGAKEKFNEKINKVNEGGRSPKDPITFEELGFDKILVDEAHQFKNLKFITGLEQVSGLGNPEGSNKALCMLMGVRSVQMMNGGYDKGIVFASGTPIVNSVIEMYSIQKYLDYKNQIKNDQLSVDAWVNFCGVVRTETEITATMATKDVTRVREYNNVVELQKSYKMFADVKDNEDARLDKPQADVHLVQVPAGELHKTLQAEIQKIAETGNSDVLNVHLNEKQISAKSLVAISKAKLETATPKLLGVEDLGEEVTKVDIAAKILAENYKKTSDAKGIAFVFSDIVEGVKKSDEEQVAGEQVEEKPDAESQDLEKDDKENSAVSDEDRQNQVMEQLGIKAANFSLYQELKEQLVAKGVPENEILIMRDVKGDAARSEAIKKLNEGVYRIAIGSTQVLGTGVNAQTHCSLVMNMDVPWTPSAIDQRNARGVRQGNEWAKQFNDNKVPVYYLIKEHSIDAKLYDLIRIKSNFIAQTKKDPNIPRNSETQDLSDADLINAISMSYGNKYFERQLNLKKELATTELAYKAFNKQMTNINSNIMSEQALKNSFQSDFKRLNAEVNYMCQNGWQKGKEAENSVAMKVGGVAFDNEPKKIGQAIKDALTKKGKCELEAYGYKASFDRLNMFEFDLVLKKRTVSPSFEGADRLSDKTLSTNLYKRIHLEQDDPTQIGLAFRSLLSRVEKNCNENGNKMAVHAEKLESFVKMRDENPVFPRLRELEAMKLEKVFIDDVCNGTVNIKPELVGRLSDNWDRDNPGKIDYKSLPDNPTYKECRDWMDANMEGITDKYFGVMQEVEDIKNACANRDLRSVTFMDRELKVNGPVVIDHEQVKTLFQPIADKVSTRQLEHLASQMVEKVFSAVEADYLTPLGSDENMPKAVVNNISAYDGKMLRNVADPNYQPMQDIKLMDCNVLLVRKDPKPVTSNAVEVRNIHLQTSPLEFYGKMVVDSLKAGKMETTPKEFAERLNKVYDYLNDPYTHDVKAYQAVTNENRKEVFKETKLYPMNIGNFENPNVNIYAVARNYCPSSDLMHSLYDFHEKVTTMGAVAQQTQQLLEKAKANNMQTCPQPMSLERLGDLYEKSLSDLMKVDTPDNKIHLLVATTTDSKTGKVVPDPFVYAASADSFASHKDVYDQRVLAIDKDDLAKVADSKDFAEQFEVWRNPSDNVKDTALTSLREVLAKENIPYAEKVIGNNECNQRQALVNMADTFAGKECKAVPHQFDNERMTLSLDKSFCSLLTMNRSLPLDIYKANSAGSEKPLVALPAFATASKMVAENYTRVGTVKAENPYFNSFDNRPASIGVYCGEDVTEKVKAPAEQKVMAVHTDRAQACGVSLSESDRQNLVDFNQLGHTSKMTDLSGKEHPVLIYADTRNFGQVKAYDPTSLKLSSALEEAIGAQGKKDLLEGKCVSLELNGKTNHILMSPNNPSGKDVPALVPVKPNFKEETGEKVQQAREEEVGYPQKNGEEDAHKAERNKNHKLGGM